MDTAFATSDLKHGDWFGAASEYLPGVNWVAGSGATKATSGMISHLLHGDVKGAARAAQKGWSKVPIIGDGMRWLSRHRLSRGAEKATTREALRRSGNLKKAGKFGALTALGLGAGYLLDKGITGFASAKRKKKEHDRNAKFSDSQDWKVLRGYNKMLDHAMRVVQAAKSIKDGGDSSKSDDSDISGTSGKGDKAIRSIAKAVAKKTGMDAKNIYAQLALESSDGSSDESQKDNNFGGIKFANQSGATKGGPSPEGDNYAHFKDTDAFASAYAKLLQDDGLHGGMSIDEWAQQLKNRGYYTASEASYAAGLKSWADKYAVGGISARKFGVGSGMIASRAAHGGSGDIYGEAGTEAYIPLNNSHYSSGLSALGDLAGLFGKKVVDAGETNQSQATTINPNYNINLTIQGGTDDPQVLAQTVADKVREMLSNYDNQKAMQNEHAYFQNETSSQFI